MNIEELIEQPFVVLTDLVRVYSQDQPEHPALIQDERTLNYAQLNALVDRIAASLQRDGLKPGDALAICAFASIEYAAVFLGGLRAGVAVAPLAPSSTAQSLVTMAADAGATLFFVDAGVAAELEPVKGQLSAKLISLDGSPAGQAFQDWLAPAGAKPVPVAIAPEAPFNIIYSSGTTGAPKGIVQSHGMRWAHVQRGTLSGYGPQAISLISTPLYSNTTLVCFFPTIGLGGTVVLMAKFDAKRYLELAQKHRVTHTMLVPVQYQRIMSHPDFNGYDLSSFQKKFCTSAPFSAALKADILKRWPGGLVEYYGMTEGGGTCILVAHEHPDKLHTVGCPAPGHDIRLIDDNGNEVAQGEIGEVVGHSPAMMNEYHNQPEKTAEVEWFDPTGKRFIRTGDVGRFDEDGFLTLLDRKKDMIISGGFNVYPSDLEVVLRQHPELEDVAVVGVPSERWGETPVAFAVPRPGSRLGSEELLAWANERLGKTQRLAAVRIVDSLPRSAIGKVLKRELRDGFRSERQLP
ncbi:MAG: 4-coumarate--CoA ligase [Burkholderiales bacterium RIFCSPLOWO2_02_FULL_57_36]|nr:MAG: 4-coumarate--CoA ligase [Burkholderiales bacterium RIFCSPLOWO2_02_FULL_57_36]